MKKMLTVLAACVIILISTHSGAEADIEFRVTAGVDYISYGDFNNFVDDYNDLIGDVDTFNIISDELGNIHWTPEVNGEVRMSILPALSAGLSVGFLYGKSDFSYSEAGVSFSYEHKVTVYPIKATGYFTLPTPSFKPYVYGGAGLYVSKLEFENYLSGGGEEFGYTAELNKTGFGLHGGAGIRFSFTPIIGFDIGVMGRWADIKGFEGTATSTEGEEKDVFLAYQEEDDDVLYGPESVDEKDNYGEGSLDLSGYGFYVGLSVGF